MAEREDMVTNFSHKPDAVLRQMIEVHAEAIVWLAMVGHCNLALRHPLNIGPSATVAQDFVDALMKNLHERGVLTREEFDFAWNEQEPFRRR